MQQPVKTIRFLSVVLLFSLLLSCLSGCGNTGDTQNFSDGISKIQELETADPNAVDEILKEYHHQAIIDECEARLAQVDSGEISVWSLFDDYVIIGDSRAANFTTISELDPNRNLGSYANTTIGLKDDYDTIRAFNPAYLIVVIGLNDLRHVWVDSTEDFDDCMTSAVQDLQENFPDVKIFLNPIFPVIQAGLDRHPTWSKWAETAEYDAVVRNVADKTGVYYVNCDNIPIKDSYYSDDGVHFTVEFMTLWARNIIATIYDAELGLYTSADGSAAASDTAEADTSSEVSAEASAE